MSETREEFEKLPEIAEIFKGLHPTIIWFCDKSNKYATSFSGFDDRVMWLNGAWCAFQEQQKIIDAYKIILKARIGFDIVNSILDQNILADCHNGVISKGEFLVSSKNSDSGQSKEVSINISKDGKITKIGD